ncbi:hypothetical protein AMECASPLE_023556 [Ameca splendens]|uniref:Uncharacterized protein n=1 Tax=Ameca splendens TaxID=208324 RepID=A0ABV0YRR0_9TELE
MLSGAIFAADKLCKAKFPCLCQSLVEDEGRIAHRLMNPAVHIRGSTSAEPVLGSLSLVYFLTYTLAVFRTSRFHNLSSSGFFCLKSSSLSPPFFPVDFQ